MLAYETILLLGSLISGVSVLLTHLFTTSLCPLLESSLLEVRAKKAAEFCTLCLEIDMGAGGCRKTPRNALVLFGKSSAYQKLGLTELRHNKLLGNR